MKNEIKIRNIGRDMEFRFDRVFHNNCTQKDIFDSVAHVVQGVLEGFNGSLMAYGQTSSGKTHTMQGYGDHGIMLRSMETIFAAIGQAGPEFDCTVKLSFVEIYCEKIQDLLNPKGENLKVHENPVEGVHIADATQVSVWNMDDVNAVLREGKRNRATSATKMNAGSSRSHALLQVQVTQVNRTTSTTRRAKLMLVDLAGSERVGKTGVTGGARMEEAKNINRSLTTLGIVIKALADSKVHVPYRDSKLTRVMQESLGGNSRTALVICCAPEARHAPETISTLRFGERARQISTKVSRNETMGVEQLRLLLAAAQAELERLRAVLALFLKSGALPAHVLNEARALGFSEDGVLMDDDTTSEANSERAYLVEEDDEMKAGIKILMSNTLARHGRTVAFDDQDADDLDLSSGTAAVNMSNEVVDQLRADLARVAADVANREADVTKLSSELDHTKRLLKAANDQVKDLTTSLSAKSEEAKLYKAEIRKLEASVNMLQNETQSSTAKAAEAERQLRQRDEELEALRATNAAKNQEVERLTRELTDNRKLVEGAKNEASGQQKELMDQLARLQKELEQERKSVKERDAKLVEADKAMKETAALLSGSQQALQEARDDRAVKIATATAEASKLEAALRKLEEESGERVSALKTELANAEKAHATAAGKLQSELQSREEKLSQQKMTEQRLQDAVKASEAAVDKLRAEADDRARQEAQLRQLMKEQETRLAQHEKALHSLNEAARDLEDVRGAVSQASLPSSVSSPAAPLSQAIRQLDTEARGLRESLATAQTALQQTKQELAARQSEVAKLRSELDVALQHQKELTADLAQVNSAKVQGDERSATKLKEAEARCAELNQRSEALSRELSELRSEMQAAQKEKQELVSEASTRQKTEAERAASKLNESEGKCKELATKSDKLSRELQDLREELNAAVAKKQQLEAAMEESNRQRQQEAETAAARLRDSEGRCMELKSRCDELDKELRGLREEVKTALLQKEGLLAEVTQQQRQEAERAAAKLKQSEERCAELQSRSDNLTGELRVMKEEMASALKQKEDLLAQAGRQQQETATQASTALRESEGKCATLQSKSEALEHELNTLRDEMKMALQKKHELLTEASAQRQKDAEANASKLRESEGKCAKLQGQCEALSRELQELREEMRAALQKKQDLLTEAATQKKQEAEHAAATLTETEKRCAEFKAQCESLSKELQGLRSQLQQALAHREELSSAIAETTDQKQKEAERAAARLHETETRCAELKTQSATLSQQLQEIREQLKATQKLKENLSETLDEAKAQNKADAERAAARLAECEGRAAEWKTKSDALVSDLQVLREEMKTALHQKQLLVDRLTEQLSSSGSTLDRMQAERDRQLTALQGQMEELRNTAQTKQAEAEKLRASLQALSSEVKGVERELTETKGKSERLAQELQQLRGEMKIALQQKQELSVALDEANQEAEQDVFRNASKIREIEARSAHLTSELKQVREELRVTLQQKQELMSSHADRATATGAELQKLRAEKDQHVASLMAQIASSEALAKELQGKIEDQRRAQQLKQTEIDQLRTAMSNMEDKVKESERKAQDARAAQESMQKGVTSESALRLRAVADLQEQLKGSRAQEELLQSGLAKLGAELEEEHKENARLKEKLTATEAVAEAMLEELQGLRDPNLRSPEQVRPAPLPFVEDQPDSPGEPAPSSISTLWGLLGTE